MSKKEHIKNYFEGAKAPKVPTVNTKKIDSTTTKGKNSYTKNRLFDNPEQPTHEADSFSNIQSINPENVINWQFHDRPETEIGDIDSLAEEFKTIGQQQPCIVRPYKSSGQFKYELIVGERRWRAALKAGVDLQAIVKELNDTDAALSQAAENENRVNLSDYAKGMSYSRLIDMKIIKQKDLIEKLGKTKQYISTLLSFSKIPDEIINAIGDLQLVSARTAETIKRLSSKGDAYTEAIIEKSDALRSGKIGNKGLSDYVYKRINKEQNEKNQNLKILSNDGRHIYTWRKDNNQMPSIHFPKNVAALIQNNKIDFEGLSDEIKNVIETKLEELKKSARAD